MALALGNDLNQVRSGVVPNRTASDALNGTYQDGWGVFRLASFVAALPDANLGMPGESTRTSTCPAPYSALNSYLVAKANDLRISSVPR